VASRLSLTHFRQEDESGGCLPACVQMVLAHLGIVRSQTDLARLLGTQRGVGTPAFNIARLASEELDVVYTSGSLEDAAAWLDSGVPVIAFVQAGELPDWRGERSHHALVIVGLESGVVHLLDPETDAQVITVSTGDFLLAWDERACTYAIITRRQ
jgi:ABC-type bacteriocin/lantibiotic exporter with double-glycine peptidase domain